MNVIKRNGSVEELSYNKIIVRLQQLAPEISIHYSNLVLKIMDQLYDNINTYQIDELMAELCASLGSHHYDYSTLANKLCISNHHKDTPNTILGCIESIQPGYLSVDYYNFILLNHEYIESIIDYSRDYLIDYFGFKTLERAYLIKNNGKIVERIQHLWMRVAIQIHAPNLDKIKETYNGLSTKEFIHATPTLYNAGTNRPQLSSCFLLGMESDSIDGIYNTLKDCAKISKWAGGIGLHIHNIRATGSHIDGTNGTSNGIVPMLRVFNDTARYVDQGGGKRKGAFAIYIEPWHADIFSFLDLRKNHGKEEMRARDLFFALWICDLFMKRVEADGEWSLFCPNEAPGLSDCHGEVFEALYTKYEAEGRARKTIKAQELWFAILDSQIETGTPYMLYKDAANSKSNQQNLGTIKSSNLCTEIIEYTSPEEVAVCNLASIALPRFVINGSFDQQKLYEVTYQVALNLNKIIDNNYYPVEEARNSNLRHRPIGLGVQGLADVFILLRLPFESDLAKLLNKNIFETIYFAAMTASKDLAIKEGPYSTFQGSPLSKGQFQFDLWNVAPSTRWDWDSLRKEVMEHGVRNSLLLAPMPTASTSQILGNNECFEPYTSNIYSRRVLSGEFIIVNKHLLKDLISLGLWNNDMKNRIIAANGSVQNIKEIPDEIKELYKTVWEIKQRNLIDMAADRGAFICQSQSLNLFVDSPSISKLTSMHFYGWKKGLKTGMYYLRSQAATQAVQFTIEKQGSEEMAPVIPQIDTTPENKNNLDDINTDFSGPTCSMEDGCVSCGS